MLVVRNTGRISRKEIDRLFEMPGGIDRGIGRDATKGVTLEPRFRLGHPIRLATYGAAARFRGAEPLERKGLFDKISSLGRMVRKGAPEPEKKEEKKEEFAKEAFEEDLMLCSMEADVDSLDTSYEEAVIGAAAAPAQEPVKETAFDREIEEIVKERWRYLVMQFGGVFLTELRPNRCFVGNKSLADLLIKKDGKNFSLDLDLLENYLKGNYQGQVQLHLSDIMFNPEINDYDIFCITSGDTGKANIFLDLARFLSVYNKGKETVIPIHLPYFEKFKTTSRVVSFGELSEDGKRDAVTKAERVLRYLEKKWPAKEVRLALETGNGESKRNGSVAYALIYELHHLKFLMPGRESLVTLCEDVGHLNLVNDVNWKDYLSEHVSEFHVSGNNGKQDEHTIATPETLKNYHEIISFLKFYSGNICAEIGKGNLSPEEFLQGVKKLAYELFSNPDEHDFNRLKRIELYLRINQGKKISERNLSQEKYEKFEGKK